MQTQGLGFQSEATDYNIFITLHANYRALIKHTHMHMLKQFLCGSWTAEFLLKIDLQAVVCRCFAEEFITSLQCTAVSHMHEHTHTSNLRTQHACEHSRPVEQSNTFSFRIFEIQTNKQMFRWETERKAGGKHRKEDRETEKHRKGVSEEGNEQALGCLDGADEDCGMTEMVKKE